ncbi:MAG TPA: PP2C family protein-serine/threonine phosphatase [Solirubrobacteraceae bacterium]|nr:PP2C family protein-serine/threonine phosphatase [Solirubrobacteraceae bacterium]
MWALVTALLALAGAAGPAQAATLLGGLGAGSSSSPASEGASSSLHVAVGSLLDAEAGSGGVKVDVPGVVKVETPPLPHVETPSLPVETPSLPAETPAGTETPSTPTVSTPTPAPVSVGSSSSSGQSASGSQGSAHAASVAGSAGSASGGATQADGSNSAATHAAGGEGGKLLRSGARRTAHGAREASRRAAAATAAGGAGGQASAQGTPTGLAPARAAGSSSRAHAKHKSFASDPLGSIGRQLPFPAPVPDWSRPIILVLLLLAIAFGIRARLATRRARRLQARHDAMLSDLDEMQKALVPAVPERLGALGLSVAYRPSEGPAAGGDFYDLFALDRDRVAIVLGDVVGHGRDALAQAALTRYTLRAYLQAGLEPRAALALAGSVLSTPGEKRFATVVVAVHDGASGRLTYACAGHPPPIAVGFEVPEPIAVCCSAPICCDLPTGVRQTTLTLPASGGMCFFSDGLPETRVGEGLLGRERLAELLAGLGPKPDAPALLERVRREASTAQSDDMVACIVTAPARPGSPGAAPAEPQVEELEVDPEMLASDRARDFLEACGLDPARVASVLARVRELAGRDGRALVRVERPLTGEASVVGVTACAAPSAAAIADVHGASPELALAPAAAR